MSRISSRRIWRNTAMVLLAGSAIALMTTGHYSGGNMLAWVLVILYVIWK